MIKKSLLTISILAATCSMAFAADNTSTYCKSGFYAGLQGGRGDTFYHADDLLSQAATNGTGATQSIINNAFSPSGQPVDIIINSLTTSRYTKSNIDDSGIAGRLYTGYQFNPYVALETGFTQFSKTDFSASTQSITQTHTKTIPLTGGNPTYNYSTDSSQNNYSGDVTERAVDLVAKATLPLQYGFGVYAKAGMALITADRYINSNTAPGTDVYTNYDTDSNGNPTTVDSSRSVNSKNNLSTVYTQSYQAFRPTYGAGIDYTIPNTAMDVEVFYSEIAGSGAIPTASLWGAGVAYKFA